MADIFGSDIVCAGNITAKSMTLPASSVTDAAVQAAANIAASKLVGQWPLTYHQAPGSSVAADTADIHIVRGASGVTLSIKGAITGVIPTTSDTVTVDLQRSTGAGAFATVLSSTLQFTASVNNVLRTAYAGAITTTTLVAGDILRLVITVSGTSAKGLIVDVVVQENPN